MPNYRVAALLIPGDEHRLEKEADLEYIRLTLKRACGDGGIFAERALDMYDRVLDALACIARPSEQVESPIFRAVSVFRDGVFWSYAVLNTHTSSLAIVRSPETARSIIARLNKNPALYSATYQWRQQDAHDTLAPLPTAFDS